MLPVFIKIGQKMVDAEGGQIDFTFLGLPYAISGTATDAVSLNRESS